MSDPQAGSASAIPFVAVFGWVPPPISGVMMYLALHLVPVLPNFKHVLLRYLVYLCVPLAWSKYGIILIAIAQIGYRRFARVRLAEPCIGIFYSFLADVSYDRFAFPR